MKREASKRERLPVASLVSPAPAGLVRSAPTFKWNVVLTPTLTPAWGASRYHLQVANSPTGFSAPFEDVVLDTLTWTPTRSYQDGVYYWRVAARDAANRDGPFSPVYTFTKQYRGTTLVSPLSGAPGNDFPTFVWTAVEGAARYRIEIAKNAQFSPLWDSADSHNTRFMPTKKYDSAQYYWRVAMIDKNGVYGPYTGAVFLNDPLPHKVYLPGVLKNR